MSNSFFSTGALYGICVISKFCNKRSFVQTVEVKLNWAWEELGNIYSPQIWSITEFEIHHKTLQREWKNKKNAVFPESELLCLTADTVTHATELAKHCITSTSLLIKACPGLKNKLIIESWEDFYSKSYYDVLCAWKFHLWPTVVHMLQCLLQSWNCIVVLEITSLVTTGISVIWTSRLKVPIVMSEISFS